MIWFLVIFLATWMGSFGMLFLKRGSVKFSLHPLKLLRNRNFLFGALLYAASLPVYLVALKHLPLSVAYPLTSMTYIWSAFLGKKLLNEGVDSWRWTGIGLIILGITLVAL